KDAVTWAEAHARIITWAEAHATCAVSSHSDVPSMPDLKQISKRSIPTALEKALRYRLLNEPVEAESICRDVLAVDPGNLEALRTLLLAITDQFATEFHTALAGTQEVLKQFTGQYEREYYGGIVYERWGKAQCAARMPNHVVAGWIRQAMRCYEQAEAVSTSDDPDPMLRWNACVRFLQRYEVAAPESRATQHDAEPDDTDEVPRA
ncbi:MAG: hypothetical protein WD468_04250, partial [Pirellulales bacterium]